MGFFWTWKTQSNLDTGKPYNPLWCYSCGLEYGYVPQDPAAAAGACPRIARQLGQGGYGSNVPLTETLAASMTGNAATTSSVVAAQRSSYGQWPPTSITNIAQATNLPRYTATGAEPNYPTTLVTPLSSVATGAPKACDWYTSIAGCQYPNPYSGVGAQVPGRQCTGTGAPASTCSAVTAPVASAAPTGSQVAGIGGAAASPTDKGSGISSGDTGSGLPASLVSFATLVAALSGILFLVNAV